MDRLRTSKPTRVGPSLPLLLAIAVCTCQAVPAQTGKAANPTCKPGSAATACKAKAETAPSAPPSPDSKSATPSASSAFPFPVEDSQRGGAAGEKPTAPAKGLPEMPTSGVADPPASSEQPLGLPPDLSGNSASDSSSSRAAEDDDIAPTTSSSDAPIRSSALKDLGSRGATSAARARLEQTRVSDDLKVGSFYMKDGNAEGAYLRFKDALDRAPDDPDVRFNLAEAAGKLNKRDEAQLNYQEYLRLDPGGDHDKASRKALSRLGVVAR